MALLPEWVTRRFNYDALNPRGRRRLPTASVKSVDAVLTEKKRDQLTSNSRDLARNFAIAQWMVRRHLDYVTQFAFEIGTGDRGLDRDISLLMEIDSKPAACDVGARCSREKMFRVAEMRSVIDGDCGLLKLSDGRLEGIEGDLVRNPPEKDPVTNEKRRDIDRWLNGVKLAPGGRHVAYSLYRRVKDGTAVFDRTVSASQVLWHGCYDHFATNQARGVSPLVAALNPLRDVYENFEYALARAKIDQLFGLAFFREADSSYGSQDTDGTAATTGDTCTTEPRYKVDLSRGNFLLDLDPGDKVEAIQSQQPSSQFQAFTEMVIAAALKALDIPFSFYNESFTNFFGSRAAMLHYERSCKDKRDAQAELRRQYTIWKLFLWIESGRLVLPASKSFGDLNFAWTPRGMQWWKPSEEINGDRLAVSAGFNNPYRICQQRDTGTFEENIDQLAKALKYAEEIGMQVLGRPIRLDFDNTPEVTTEAQK